MAENIIAHSGFSDNELRAIQARFEEWFIPEPNSGCWLWLGRGDRKGYGRFRLIRSSIVASRASFRIYRSQEFCADLLVCHRCDNPPCVNPEHLFLGTNTDNARDRDKKGRAASQVGSLNNNAKINEATARLIKNDLAENGGKPKLTAKKFQVPLNVVKGIRGGEKWKHA